MDANSGCAQGCGGCLFLLAIPGIPILVIWLIWNAISSVIEHRKAEEARKLNEAQARESEFKRKQLQQARDFLEAAGQVVYLSNSGNKMIRCSNGHRYMFCDFMISISTIEKDSWSNEYYTGCYDEMGCPACKSKILSFDDRPNEAFRVCNNCKCAWNTRGNTKCPSCNPGTIYAD